MSDGKMARSAAKIGEALGQNFPKSTFLFKNQAEPGAGNNDGDHHDDDDDEDDGKLCRGLCPTDTGLACSSQNKGTTCGPKLKNARANSRHEIR